MTETIVLLDMTAPERAEKLRAFLPPGFVLTHGTARGDEHMKQIIAEADYAISGQVGVNADVLRAAKKLKLLHKWGVGYDNVDVEACTRRGILLTITPEGVRRPVARNTSTIEGASLASPPAASETATRSVASRASLALRSGVSQPQPVTKFARVSETRAAMV